MPSIRQLSRVALGALALAACASRPGATVTPAAEATVGGLPLGGGGGLQRDAALAALLAEVDPARIRRTDSTLVAFGTRHTMSDTVSATRGIGAARRWIFAELSRVAGECGGCLRVEYDPAMITVTRHPDKPSVNVVNVLAWLPGRDTSRVIVLGGHYDSCVCNVDRFDATSDAPGADDDGSGTSAVMELARVFAKRYPHGLDATIVFAIYAGEEQGLLGSTHFADRLHAQGYRVVAGMTDDIDGNVIADDGTVDSTSIRAFAGDPDNGPSRELLRHVWTAGEVYQPEVAVLPVFRLDRIQRGGDHIPFHNKGDAAVRFTERLENYKRQHLPTDTLGAVSFGYVAKVARLNAATVGTLAAAPATPDSTTARRDAASGGQRWRLTWRRVAGAASYEVLIRRTTSPRWERAIAVGSDTTMLLPVQLDDAYAGVRSVGANGHRSLAAVVPAAAFVSR
ncbi:MAG TPA: M28 family peptidase [Gemmatimonadaceae bacterium]|nr:M28 family peptidase [Gemmatimonadaceae bacterium]